MVTLVSHTRSKECKLCIGQRDFNYFAFQSDKLGPDLQNILRQSYDYLTIMPNLRSTYDGRLIYETSYEELEAFLRHDSLAKL